MTAEKNPYNGKSSICPQFGKYTMAVSGTDNAPLEPVGFGYATISVTKAGKAKLIGSLADGTRFIQSAALSSAGTIPLYAGLYKGQGSYSGWLQFNETTGTTPNSTTTWIKPALPKEKYYPAGFTNQLTARTSVYAAPTKGNRIVDLANALLLLNGGDLTTNLEITLALDSKNHVTSSASNKLSLVFALSNGTFKGKSIDPASGKPISPSPASCCNQSIRPLVPSKLPRNMGRFSWFQCSPTPSFSKPPAVNSPAKFILIRPRTLPLGLVRFDHFNGVSNHFPQLRL